MWGEVRVVDIVEVLQRGVHRLTIILKILPRPPSIGTLHRREDGALQLAVAIGGLTGYQPSASVVDEGPGQGPVGLLVRAGYGPELACKSADPLSHGLGMGQIQRAPGGGTFAAVSRL